MNVRQAVGVFRGHRVPNVAIIQRKKWWFLLSGIVMLLSLGGLFFRGLNLSIDFKGGALITYPFETQGLTAAEVSATLARAPFNRGDAEVQIVSGNQISIRTASLNTMSDQDRTALVDALAKQAGVTPNDVSRTDVGPTWGSQISHKAVFGLIAVLIAITLYIALRFEWKMAIGAQLAMIHDVVITAGVYALTGRQVTPATVIAVLTILGFSLYDTVVIYDKIQENTESPVMLAKDSYSGVVNTSMNQVLMRSVNTSLVVVLPIGSLLLFGGDTLKDFAFAMMVGVISGAYSSIFVAAPILSVLKEHEPKYAQIRAKAGARAAVEERRPRPAPERQELPVEDVATARRATAGAVATAAATRTTARQGSSSKPRPKGKKKPTGKRKRR